MQNGPFVSSGMTALTAQSPHRSKPRLKHLEAQGFKVMIVGWMRRMEPGSLPDYEYSQAMVEFGQDKLWDETILATFAADETGGVVKGSGS